MIKARNVCLVILMVVLWTDASTSAQVHIEDLRIGFGTPSTSKEGNYKIGDWAPARVTIWAQKTGFDGMLELSTPDSDDLETAFYRPVHLEPGDSIPVQTFVKPGKMLPEVTARLIDREGRLRARTLFNTLPDGARQDDILIVTLGHPAGLDAQQLAKKHGSTPEHFRIAQLETARDLPARWYGYEAVDYLILCTDRPEELEKLDPALQESLRDWVRHGGHMVVSVGAAWQRVAASFLGRMAILPADIDGAETVKQLRDFETFVGSSPALNPRDEPISIPHLANVRGQIAIGSADLPLAVRGPFGLGTVTLVALDLNERPFAAWESRTDFWLKLLAVPKPRPEDAQQQVARMAMGRADLSSHLRLQLEQFEGISLVPFQWVAFFIFLYILLIGPVDYLLVKKVFKRMELTWVTFPSMVIGVSVVAYFTAYWLKGDKLRINKVDVIDVDQASGTLRGTSWFTLFSPQIKNYTVKLEPELCSAPVPPGLESNPPVVLSWLGLAEDAMGGMGRPGGAGLFRRGYRFGLDAQTLEEVPVQVWSMKGFTARWHGQATPVVTADVKRGLGPDTLLGSLTNQLPVPLQQCVLAFGRKAYPLDDIPANGSIQLGGKSEDLTGYVTRRAGTYGVAQPGYNPYQRGQPPQQFNPNDLIVTMMFHNRLPEGHQYAANDYFDDLELSEHLDQRHAVLVARVPARGSKLILNGSEVAEDITTASYVRVILPVTGSAPPPSIEMHVP